MPEVLVPQAFGSDSGRGPFARAGPDTAIATPTRAHFATAAISAPPVCRDAYPVEGRVASPTVRMMPFVTTRRLLPKGF